MEHAGKVTALEENYTNEEHRTTQMCRPVLVIYVILL